MSGSPRFGALDRFRPLAALLVVALRTYPLADVSPDAEFLLTRVLARLAVPFFLMATGQFALLPLLQELGCPEGVDEAYWQEVLGKTRAMAEAYPLYLSTNAPAALPGAVQLSERALQVLRLQDRGLTRSEIARQLQLSERSVKYQCEKAYHKLGTSNKVEALGKEMLFVGIAKASHFGRGGIA